MLVVCWQNVKACFSSILNISFLFFLFQIILASLETHKFLRCGCSFHVNRFEQLIKFTNAKRIMLFGRVHSMTFLSHMKFINHNGARIYWTDSSRFGIAVEGNNKYTLMKKRIVYFIFKIEKQKFVLNSLNKLISLYI